MTADTDVPSLSIFLEKALQRTHPDTNVRARRVNIAIACLTPLIIALLWTWFYIFFHTHTIRAHVRNLLLLALVNVLLIAAEQSYTYFQNLRHKRQIRDTELQSVSIQPEI